MKKFVSFKHYIAYLKKQPEHLQHIYAGFFAGSITILLALLILYSDYGFFHEKYVREDTASPEAISEPTFSSKSPFDMFTNFIGEATEKLGDIRDSGRNLFKGTETYSKKEEETILEENPQE